MDIFSVSTVLTIPSTPVPKFYKVAAKLQGLGLQERYFGQLFISCDANSAVASEIKQL
jgi:hypothetical protein